MNRQRERATHPSDAVAVDVQQLVAFANTGHGDADELADPGALSRWWQGQDERAAVPGTGGPGDPGQAQHRGLDQLRDLRQVVRGAVARNVAGAPEPASEDVPGLRVSLTLDVSARGVSPVTDAGGLPSMVESSIVGALLRVSALPGWRRVKSCPGPGCGWVFLDDSRNASRRWCDMTGCGNRAKGARFRARRRSAAEGAAEDHLPG